MNRTEFMDLLRYYFRRVSDAELQEILSDYEAHFEEGKKAGLTEEEICRELGSPKDVYEMYLHEGMIHEEEPPAPQPSRRAEKIADTADRLAGHAERLAGQAEKLAGDAGKIAGTTISRAQDAWDRSIAPQLPEAAETAGGLVWKVLFSACYAASFLVFLITALLVYLLSGTFPAFGGFSPLPSISAATLFFLGGTGFFAGLALFFAGSEIRRMHRARHTPPSSGASTGAPVPPPSPEDSPKPQDTIQPAVLLLPAAGRK